MQSFDMIIVGGGLVGTSLAIALRHTGLRIALIDARPPSYDDPRLFALNISCCEFLMHLNAFQGLEAHATPIHEVHVSRQGRFGAVRLRREALKLNALGYVIPAYHVEKELNDQLHALSHCTVYRPARLHTLTQDDDTATLMISYQEKELILTAPIVIGADGTNSTVRSQLEFDTATFDYEQSALVTRVLCSHHHAHRAYERFIETGAVALLPLKDNECALILTLSTQQAQALMQDADDVFLKHLQQHFGARLGRFLACKKRYIFPLKMVKAKKAINESVYLLGNAAQTLHPIAAQGFNLALYEVALLVDLIQSKVKAQKTFNKKDLYLIWEKTKKQKSISMDVSHHLSQLFLQEAPLSNMMTQLGMMSMTLLPPLKNYFLKRLLGRSGHVPKLLLGKFE